MQPPSAASGRIAGTALSEAIPTWALLTAGLIALPLSGNRAGVPVFGWVAPIPFLIAATRLRSWRGRAVLAACCLAAACLLAGKVVDQRVPVQFSLVFGIPIGLGLWLTFAIWDALRRRAGPASAIYLYASLVVLVEYAFYGLSPAGDWGALLPNSQLENLPLLQVASLGGLGAVAMVMAWPIGATAMLLVTPDRRWVIPHLVAGIAVLLGAQIWGAARLDRLETGPVLRVAGITVDMPDPLTSYDQFRGADSLFARSERAAERGAALVIWNEGATLVDPEEEPALRARGVELAKRRGIDLVLAYFVLVSRQPLTIDNKYEWIGGDGAIVERYRKHFVVPSDPNLTGTAPIRVLDRPWGKAAGAICYDYDSPAIARAHGRQAAGLVALPASDWRGIDPYHSLMARVRAIEGGMSVVRPTRASTSMAFDPYGRIRASMSAWEANDHIMMTTVPSRHVDTLYSRLGNWPVLVALVGFMVTIVVAVRGRRRGIEASWSPDHS